MVTLEVEFFHDVICSYCFPMSYRMRQLQERMPEINIVHRSFALAPDSKTMDLMFGSHENAKTEILIHWKHANENDDLHRFNIEGMRKQDFLFPHFNEGAPCCQSSWLYEWGKGLLGFI